jgi:hypothetical protein
MRCRIARLFEPSPDERNSLASGDTNPVRFDISRFIILINSLRTTRDGVSLNRFDAN